MTMKEIKDKMLEKSMVWAVYGATPDTHKFGYKILDKMKKNGYEVYGVNPKYHEIDGDKVYENLNMIPKKVDCIDVVVNPKIAMSVIDEALAEGISYIWFQPGTHDEEVIKKAVDKGLNVVYDHCVYAILK